MRQATPHTCSAAFLRDQRDIEYRRPLTGHVLILLGLVLFAADARAFCDAIHPLPELYVGDTDVNSPTYDPACTQGDIQSAIDAATCSYGTKIFITQEIAYAAQSLTIGAKNITLIARSNGEICGSSAVRICNGVCPPPTPPPYGSISGTGHVGDAVLSIAGNSNVYLKYLDISGGQQQLGFAGGGIVFVGSGSVTLDATWVHDNTAAAGGGIYVNGNSATTATLNLLANSEVCSNIASGSGGTSGDGGGILIRGNAVLNALQPLALIRLNQAANGSGGGIEVIGPAQANIGSTGIGGNSLLGSSYKGVVSENSAVFGGGIAIVGGSSADEIPIVRLFSTDASLPVQIGYNTATQDGGGIYLKTFGGGFYAFVNDPLLCAWDFRIVNNHASVDGTAIMGAQYAGAGDPGSYVDLGTCESAGGGFPTGLGAVACTNSTLCNTIDGNDATDPTQGSAILIPGGYLRANRLALRNNHVAHAIGIFGYSSAVDLSDCLLADNTTAGELVYLGGGNTPLTIEACTFANNAIGASHVIHAESDLSINDSIIAEPDTLALDYSGIPANLIVHYVVSNDVTTLGGVAPGVIQGAPDFVDLAGGDYHLRAGFPGVDLAPVPGGFDRTQGVDLDGNPRNIDLPSILNAYGPRDIGAYEVQNLFRECGTSDSVFCDGFNH